MHREFSITELSALIAVYIANNLKNYEGVDSEVDLNKLIISLINMTSEPMPNPTAMAIKAILTETATISATVLLGMT